MKVFDLIYISSDSLSEGIGRSQIIPLLTSLSAKGFSINLITMEKFPPENDLKQLVQDSGVSWTILTFGNQGIVGGVKRLISLKKSIGCTKLIHGRSDIAAFAGILSGKAPVLWDVRALWSDQRSSMTNKVHLKIAYRLFLIIERYLYKKSSGISILSQSGLKTLEERYGYKKELSAVIPTAVDLKKYKYSETIPLPLKVLFSGTYNNYYDLKTSKSFIEELRSLGKIEVHWARPRESFTTRLGVGESEVFLVPSEEMPDFISEYSFGDSICRQDAGDSLSVAMPTKIAEFLAVGRPVVINKGLGDYDKLITSYRTGIVIDSKSDNLKEKAREMIEIIADPETPRRCRDLAERFFNNENAFEAYLDLYKRICPAFPSYSKG